MARKLFSFLGTGKYEPCYYCLTVGNEKVEDDDYRCYVQESLINLLPKIGNQLDEIVIFLTDEAWEKNWIKNNNSEKYDLPGLRDTLSRYKDKYIITPVKIPSGKSEDELWQIFDTMFNQIYPNDEIIFDITHSFRSIPMVSMIILNYAKFVKGCDIKGIYYGAVEALGSYQEVCDMAIEDRYSPIFNLTSFAELLDWTVGIDKFISTGDVRQVTLLIETERRRFGKKGEHDNSTFFNNLNKSLQSYIHSIATCRGQELSKNALDLKSKLEKVTDSPELVLIKPVKPLLEKMSSELKTFKNNEHKNMLKVVKWCCEHNLIQQGITILQEGVVTFLCDRYGLNRIDVDIDREVINQASAIKVKNIPFEYWGKEAKKKEQLVRRLLEEDYFGKVAKFLYSMVDTRNDINHGGWRRAPAKPKTIEKNLKEFLKEAEQLIEEGLRN